MKVSNKSLGFTLIELMIAMVLGLILIGGVIQVFLSSKQTYASQQALSEVQENARFALDMIAKDIRMAGYGGCSGDIKVANTVEGASGAFSDFSNGLRGYEGGVDTFPTELSATHVTTDAIVLHLIDANNEFTVDKHNANSAQIDLTAQHGMAAGTVMVIVDSNCSNMGIFMISNVSGGSGAASNAVHQTGKDFDGVQNCVKYLKGEFDCSVDPNSGDTGATKDSYTPGSSVYAMSSLGYFIRDSGSDTTVPGLYRIASDLSSAEELVQGIEDLEIWYGVPSGSNLQFKKAGSVASTEWELVSSVRIIVTSRSVEKYNGDYVRRSFTSTIQIRNRGV